MWVRVLSRCDPQNVTTYYTGEKFHLVSRQEKLISAHWGVSGGLTPLTPASAGSSESLLPADCLTCRSKAQSEVEVVVVEVVGGGGDFNADLIVNNLLTPSLISPPPPRLCSSPSGWIQVIKQRLRRLLRPPKEEKKSKPPSSTVATVGLEEIKAKVQHVHVVPASLQLLRLH